MEPMKNANAGIDDIAPKLSMAIHSREPSCGRRSQLGDKSAGQFPFLSQDSSLPELMTSRGKSNSLPEKRDISMKRNSFFAKRPKSVVATNPLENPNRPQTPFSLGVVDANHSTSKLDGISVATEADTSKSRFLFGRSRKNRKSSGSKIRSSSPVDADDEDEHYKFQPSSGERRMRISNPFGFQHVAKIEKQRESTDSSDIFADFRALRRGHRTAVIGPSRDPAQHPISEDAHPQRGPPPLRPKRSDELLSPPRNDVLPLRQIRSVETFVTAMPPPQLHPFTNPANVRPCANRPVPLDQAQTMFAPDYQIGSLNSSIFSHDMDRLLSPHDSRTSTQHEFGFQSGVQTEIIVEPVRSPMFQPPLEQVPEEPEGTPSHRPSVDYSRQPSIRHAKSSPGLSRSNSKISRTGSKISRSGSKVSQSSSRISSSSMKRLSPSSANSVATTMDRPISQFSDTLGDSKRMSIAVKELEFLMPRKLFSDHRETPGSWEDDIDYCYQHAAEADCDFDWMNPSRLDVTDSDDLYRDDGAFINSKSVKTREQSHSMASTASSDGDQYRLTSRVYQVPSREGCPDLDYRSSHSASSNSISALTPMDNYSFPSSPERSKNLLTPSPTPLYQTNMSQSRGELISEDVQLISAVASQLEARSAKPQSCDHVKQFEPSQLPTPPPSAGQSPVIQESVNSKTGHPDLSVDTIIAQLRARTMDSPISPDQPASPDYPPPPPPKSPRTLARQSFADVPALFSRTTTSSLNAAKLKSIDAQGRIRGLGPTSMPRTNSDDSVVTAISSSKQPTQPKTLHQAGAPPLGLTFLNTPSPSHSPNGSSYFTPASSPRSTSLPQEMRVASRLHTHRKVFSDSAARVPTAPPIPVPPKSPASANGVRASRSSYSLFPQPAKDMPKQPDLKALVGSTFSAGMQSTSTHGAAYPTSTRLPVVACPADAMSSDRSRSGPRPKVDRVAAA